MTRGPKPTTLRGRAAGARELRAWVSADEYARWTTAAERAGMSLGDYLRSLTPDVPVVRLDSTTGPDATLADFLDAIKSLDRTASPAPAFIAKEARCIGEPDYRPATPEERAADPGLHGFALGFGRPIAVYEPTPVGPERKDPR